MLLTVNLKNGGIKMEIDDKLYTIGHRNNYLAAIQRDSTIHKSAGGYAFRTVEEAQQAIDELRQPTWAIWELDGEWDADVGEDGYLKHPVKILGLVEEL